MNKRLLLVGLVISVVLVGLIAFFVFRKRTVPNQTSSVPKVATNDVVDLPVPLGGGGGQDLNNFSSSSIRTTTTLDTEAQIALPRNNGRKYALVVNDSDTDLYIFLRNFDSNGAASTTVIRNRGMRINAGGGYYEILPENLWQGDIWVASTTVSGKRLIITQGL